MALSSLRNSQFITCATRWKIGKGLKYSFMYTFRTDLGSCVIIAVFITVLIFWQVIDNMKIWFKGRHIFS